MKKIILLPSYFPTKNAPIIGSQIYEQTLLLSGYFDFKVVICQPGMGIKRYVFFTLIKFFTGKEKYMSCVNQKYDKLDVAGVYYFRSNLFSYKKNLKLQLNAYKHVINSFLKNNWIPDLFHARTAEYAGLTGAHLSKAYGIPLVLTENCSFIINEDLSIERIKAYKFAIESADTLLVVSNYLKGFLLTNNFDCTPVAIGNWIDENTFKPAAKTEKNKTFTILTIGYASYIKDWPTFFKAVDYIINHKGVTDIKIIMCVTLSYDEISENYFTKEVVKYSLTGFVEIRHQVPRKEIRSLFQAADVFVATSISETFGIATAEAMFCGVPVVSTDNGGINDFITPDNGIKVPIQNYIEVAHAILKIKNGQVTFDAECVRKSVIQKYGTDAFVKNMVNHYNTTISKLTRNTN